MAGTNGGRSNGGRPSWQRITKAQREAFLEHIRAGLDRSQATAAVKAPKGSFRTLCRFDPLFEGDFEEARRAGFEPKAESLLARMWVIAHSDHPSALRACHYLSMLYSADYRTAHASGRLGLALEGADGKALEIKLAFDPSMVDEG